MTRCSTAPNTVLTPHLGYVTEENMRAFYASALEAVLAYCAGTGPSTCSPER